MENTDTTYVIYDGIGHVIWTESQYLAYKHQEDFTLSGVFPSHYSAKCYVNEMES